MKKKPFKLHPKNGDVTDVIFVDEFLVDMAVAEARPPPDQYETTDSEDDFSYREDGDIAPITVSIDPDGQYAPIFAWICKVHESLQ